MTSLSIGEVSAIIAIILNLLAVVWGASKLATKLDGVIETLKEYRRDVGTLKDEQIKQGKDIVAIKTKLNLTHRHDDEGEDNVR